MIIFTVPGNPQGKARARTFYNSSLGRMQSMTPEKTVLYENLVKASYLKMAEREEFGGFFDGEAVDVTIMATFDIPKSKSKKAKRAMIDGDILPTKKPDADNIAKVICDALNGVAYKDDTQVCALKVFKQYVRNESDEPGVTVVVERIGG